MISVPLFAQMRLAIIGIFVLLAGCGSMVHHKVERGDTLYSIGWRYDQDYRDIARWNHLKPPYYIKQGQWLRVAPPHDEWWVDEYPDRAPKYDPAPAASANRQVQRAPPPKQRVRSFPADEKADWRWPTSSISKTRVHQHDNRQKKGIDIDGQLGQNIYAAADGKVVYAGSGLVGYGRLIIIKHNRTFLSAYGHNKELLVKEGEQVKQGQTIAKMGVTDDGRSLLYFETRRNGQPVNPLSLLPTLP